MKKIVFKLSKLIPIHKLLVWLIKQDKISKCYDSVTTEGDVTFHEEAVVDNLQKDKNKILVNSGSNIRGMLLVFGYGGKIEIGKNCYIGENSKIWSGEHIVIGDNVLISHGVNVMDTNAHEIDHKLRADGYIGSLKYGTEYLKGRVETKSIFIDDDVWVGFNSIIMKGVSIGKGAIIASGSVVTKNVDAFTMVGGNPSRVLKDLNSTNNI